ncbi:MAG: hypothetical protein ACJ788_13485 [Ktedonobacteraceae bacterium]
MNILLALNYYDLAHLAPLYAALYERYSNGGVWLRLVNGDPRLVLDVQPHTINQDDRQFLDGLVKQHLLSGWTRLIESE